MVVASYSVGFCLVTSIFILPPFLIGKSALKAYISRADLLFFVDVWNQLIRIFKRYIIVTWRYFWLLVTLLFKSVHLFWFFLQEYEKHFGKGLKKYAEEDNMCLSTVYINSRDKQNQIMKDVARIEAEGKGFWFVNLFGERRFLEGIIQTIDLMDGHFVILQKERPN